MAPIPQTKQPTHKLSTTLTNTSTIGNKTTKQSLLLYIIATNWCINTKTKEILQTTANTTIKNNKWNQCPFAQCAKNTQHQNFIISTTNQNFQKFHFPTSTMNLASNPTQGPTIKNSIKLDQNW